MPRPARQPHAPDPVSLRQAGGEGKKKRTTRSNHQRAGASVSGEEEMLLRIEDQLRAFPNRSVEFEERECSCQLPALVRGMGGSRPKSICIRFLGRALAEA